MAQGKESERTVQRCQRGQAKPGAQVRKVRVDGFTAAVRARFLTVLRATCNVREAARAVGKNISSVYELKQRDPAFRAAWQEALEEAYDELELMLMRQALFGTERTEVTREGGDRQRGKVKGTKTVHSYPLATAVRLHIGHRDEVLKLRAARDGGVAGGLGGGVAGVLGGGERPDDAAVIARVRSEMAAIAERLGERTAGLSTGLAPRRDDGEGS